MTYEEILEILGKPINIETITNQSGLTYSEVVISKYEYNGYKLSITFSRSHSVNTSIWNGQVGVDYDCSEFFKVVALSIEPINKIVQKDIHILFGEPLKIGRHIELGLREEFENEAVVDYEKDGVTISKIKFGRLSYLK